jgi:hypothetical protein
MTYFKGFRVSRFMFHVFKSGQLGNHKTHKKMACKYNVHVIFLFSGFMKVH